ncbi:MAG: DEAD/DEAH box helicase [Alphaproteobacteria bacterium]|nr:DEAD/DEAH box helicase [Alphaproteobacteria bacterium]
MNFSELGLCQELSQAVADLGYTEPTPIQEKSIPYVLMGRDILGSAQTGTGKTASFTLPMIEILASGRAKARLPRSLILAPTRELAAQVADSFEKFSTYHKLSMALLIGGVSFADQNAALSKGVDVLIATPGRLLDHFERGKVLLTDVKVLVIDEADRMLDMGFIPDVERIVGLLPPLRQTLFFSATLSNDIKKLSDKFVSNPKVIEVAPPASTADTVAQHLVWTSPKRKREALRGLLRSEEVKNAVIFCNRKRDISTLVTSLKQHDLSAVALHGDMTQSARLDALQKFKDGEVPLMIASDVAARGLDIAGLSHVFNFDVPGNAEDYVHRIGRTGRAGKSGRAFTIAASEDDKKYVGAIEKLIGKPIPLVGDAKSEAPQDASEAKPASRSKKKKAGSRKTEAGSPDTGSPETGRPKTGRPESRKTGSGRKDASSNEAGKSDSGKSDSGRNDDNRSRGGRSRRKQENAPSELPAPPECKGDTLQDTGHVPAFLLRS